MRTPRTGEYDGGGRAGREKEDVPHTPPPLPEILQHRAAFEADRRAYAFLDEHGQETSVLTYRDLHERALGVAGRLRRHCRPGDRALLLFPPGLDFIVAYFACLYAHVVAVPVSPPRARRVQEATRSIIRDSEPAAVLTVTTMMEAVEPELGALCEAAPWLPLDQLKLSAYTDFRPEPCAPDSLAFLQYTSGSTAAPKGVMVSHRNLSANQEMIRRAFGHDERSTFVGWTPMYHDMGLIGNVLQPMYLGVTSHLMAPEAFIRRPLSWLAAISRYRAHTSGGPNFAFDACVAHAARSGVPDLDLSCWQVAFNGAEPIRHETLRRFTETFAPFGFSGNAHYTCYGAAEATLLASGSTKGEGPRTVEVDAEALGGQRVVEAAGGQPLVGSGRAVPGGELRIVDPETALPCPPGRIGEIWIAGDHVATGYWRRPEQSAATLRARCAGETGGSYLRSGDLGVLIDDELYVVGRLKDVIIIRGRNHYPHDIEHTVQSAHPALQPTAGAAFAVPGSGGEKLVVVQEVRRDRLGEDAAEVAASVRQAIVREHELSPGEVVLVLPGQLQKTSSGKIMRSAAKQRYLESGYDVWAPAPVA
ncbi:fatty acyl-AMP ligase [Saccharopolyspora indica]|uniref:fatty acyl-AMP ligase n=1 Tax=Saccharopolyspora indica TaxID=1229659 RepID=UPI0022EB98DA|nr:fatty acyl-AMP ligase [Saccharopolyspora indica]MDA3648375.1 fatty acyl-AMP ligase [Saccharopolyspora indica]